VHRPARSRAAGDDLRPGALQARRVCGVHRRAARLPRPGRRRGRGGAGMSALVRGDEPLPGAAVGRETLSEVPDALVPRVLAQLITEAQGTQLLLHVARDDRRLEALAEGLAFYAPQVRLIAFPAWDTVPYDRIGPNSEIVARRMAALARL